MIPLSSDSPPRPATFRPGPRGIWLLLLFAGSSLLSGPARGQDETPVELQETNYFGMGARAMGMGTAFVAVADDASAMFYNPAGLTQIGWGSVSAGLSYDAYDVTSTHTAVRTTDTDHTRLEHFAVTYPVSPYRENIVLGFSYRRWADLDQVWFKEGFLIEPTPGTRGLFELEDYRRTGSIDAWTGAAAVDLSPHVSIGATLTFLSGASAENLVQANYRATLVGDEVDLDLGSSSDPDDRLFEERVVRKADLTGFTGSLGMLFHLDSGFRLGATLDLPADLNWDGWSRYRLEDWEKIDSNLNPTIAPNFFRDDITMPLSVSGGLAWEGSGLVVAGGVRWTDYTQIDFFGEILAPPDGITFRRESAYRGVVALNGGVEYTIPTTPLRVRGGYYTKPLPYRLMAGETALNFVADPGTSEVLREYPRANIVSDQHFFTLGAGVLVEDALALDVAYQRGSWERSVDGGGPASLPTIEDVDQDRWFMSATARFR